MKFVWIFLLLSFASPAFSQITGAAPETPQLSSERPLPPSMQAELRRTQKGRILNFRDTISAQDIAKEHFNDTGSNTYSDSVISVIDTAVSLPHKEWLDSELVEIPELARFGNRIHFNYTPAIMTGTNLQPVPFDSTLLAQMNPVIIENLPFFDQSPIPMPLEPARGYESFLEAGIGNIYLPRISGWLAQSLSERSAVNLLGQYRSLAATSSAIHSYMNLNASLRSQLGPDPGIATFYSNALTLRAGYSSRSVADSNTATNDHALSNFVASAQFAGDLSMGFHYDASFADHELNDNYSSGASESSQDLSLGTQFHSASLRFSADGTYSRAALSADTAPVAGANFFGSASIPLSGESIKATVGSQGSVEWDAGAEFLGGSGTNGSSYASIVPIAHIKLPLNARWEMGASFEPQVQLASLRALTNVNPFYSPELVHYYRTSDTTEIDARSVVMDKANLAGFMSYMLSPDDEIRFEARYIARDREPIFDQITTRDSSNVFIVTPESTNRFALTASGNFLLFTRDVLTGSAEFISATISGQNRAIPFEPDFKLAAQYHFNSFWQDVQPSVAFRMISRPGQTLNFLDATIDAEFSRHMMAEFRAENILGGPSDFWPGYPEYPESIWASIRYNF